MWTSTGLLALIALTSRFEPVLLIGRRVAMEELRELCVEGCCIIDMSGAVINTTLKSIEEIYQLLDEVNIRESIKKSNTGILTQKSHIIKYEKIPIKRPKLFSVVIMKEIR
jgi:hypothetical protein